MARMTVKEIDQHYKADYTDQNDDYDQDLRFEEPAHDECIEPEHDPREDDWLFDDYYESLNEEYSYDPRSCYD